MSDLPTVVAFSWGHARYHETLYNLRHQCRYNGVPESVEVGLDLSEHMSRRPAGMSKKFWCFRHIPSFILRKLEETGGPVLYLHGDYTLREPPPAEAFEGLDVGVQRRWRYKVEESRFPMLAAPVYVRNIDRARRFVRLWEACCLNINEPEKTEHAYLLRCWQQMRMRDLTLKLDYFDPHIATLQHDADAPIVGHKDG